ncbi:hypothetical protein DUI87_05244 [Hirundo rustica rustica]|uniref:Uncharacterized protein n=1 Tax=Hirundo rustica rustica TaxID=333673 RepID=A0A3M0L3P4_HIRRU|nr:hypothetical protein DUI87_05244 [Hirundo rustica rustica]
MGPAQGSDGSPSRQIVTIPEYLQQRFGEERIHGYLSSLSLLLSICTKISTHGQSQGQLRTGSASLGNARHDCGVKPGPDAMEEALDQDPQERGVVLFWLV